MNKYFFILVLLIFCGNAYGQLEEVSLDKPILEKPTIISTKVLTEAEQARVKEYLADKILGSLIPIKNDYVDEDNRGTVKFSDKKGFNIYNREVFEESNYVKHKVIIPDGTVLDGINFAQKEPFTESIIGKNLTFKNCNLTNVKIDDSWILISTNHAQVKNYIEEVDGKDYEVIEVYRNGKFEEKKREEIIPNDIIN